MDWCKTGGIFSEWLPNSSWYPVPKKTFPRTELSPTFGYLIDKEPVTRRNFRGMVPDSEWWIAAREGDGTRLNALFSRYRPQAYALALRMCGHTPLAEDAVQDALLLAYTSLHQLKDPAAFLPWLQRIVANCCYRALRRERRLAGPEALPEAEYLIEDSVERKLERMALRDSLYTSLAQLSEPLRATMMLRYLSDFNSYEQIAEIVGIPVGTVRSRLSEGRKQLSRYWNGLQHADETECANSRYWNDFYTEIFPGMYDDAAYFKTLLHHMNADTQLVWTTGEAAPGRSWFERSFRDDAEHGSRIAKVHSCISSGNLSLIGVTFANSPEYPDHCPPTAFMITHRSHEEMVKMHIHPAGVEA